MAKGSADSDIMLAMKLLQEQLCEQQKVQASILQQLSVLQQGALSTSSSSTPVSTEASGELNYFLYMHAPCVASGNVSASSKSISILSGFKKWNS